MATGQALEARGIVLYSLAIPLTALLLWLFSISNGGVLELASTFVVAYPFALLIVFLVSAIAVRAVEFALTGWDFRLCLLGLCAWD